MRKSLILVSLQLAAVHERRSGSNSRWPRVAGADDPSTWRWQVNTILTEQSAPVWRVAALSSFDQGF